MNGWMDGWIDEALPGVSGNRGKRVFISGEQASLSLHVFVSPLPLYRILGNREKRANLFQGKQ